MKVTTFFGGHDVQRSLNMSDNKCINLIPVTNDSQTITGFIAAPGLTREIVITNNALGSGIYTASNGRCFLVAGNTLYEVTVVAGVYTLTSKGTVTGGTVTRMSDNGIELIIVNGTDGWLFKFATGDLRQIKVLQGTVTVTIASPAVFSYTAHGLAVGDAFMLATTGALPTGLLESTVYYVISAGLTADAFEASATSGGAAINTSGSQSGTHTLTSIGYGFPNGTKLVSYMNGRFVAYEPDTQNFYVSEPLDGYTWDVLNVQTVDSNPDNIVGHAVAHNELVVFCDFSGETFYDSGQYPTPFVRNQSGIFEVGCAATYSIAKVENTIYWLGRSTTGQGVIYRLQGYTPVQVSTHSIEYAMQEMSSISDALSFTYQQDGKHYYVITFPTGDRTFVYNVSNNIWHERANFRAGEFHRWEAQEYAFFGGKHLVCDYSEGHVYSVQKDIHTYGSEVRKWVRSFRAEAIDMDFVRHNKLQLDCETGTGLIDGTDQQIMLRYSDDGGHTWSTERWKTMGEIGEYSRRVIWNRLGITKGRPRVYELSGTTATKTVLLNVHIS